RREVFIGRIGRREYSSSPGVQVTSHEHQSVLSAARYQGQRRLTAEYRGVIRVREPSSIVFRPGKQDSEILMNPEHRGEAQQGIDRQQYFFLVASLCEPIVISRATREAQNAQ